MDRILMMDRGIPLDQGMLISYYLFFYMKISITGRIVYEEFYSENI